MAKISILAFPAPGHTQGIQNLAQALKVRGHNITIHTPLDGISLFDSEFKIQAFAESALPLGSLKSLAGKTTESSGIAAFIRGIRYLIKLNEALATCSITDTADLLLYDELYFRTHVSLNEKKISYSQALSFK